MSRRTDTRAAGIHAALTADVELPSRSGVRAGVAVVLLALVGTGTALRVANNAPGALPPGLATAHSWLAAAAPTAVAALVVLLGAAHRDGRTRAGLVVAGVFGPIGLHVPAAALPAVAAILGGAAVPVLAAVADEGATRRGAVAAVLWCGLALSLASATGVLAASLRPAASTVALVGVALLPVALASPPGASLTGRPIRGAWRAGGPIRAAWLAGGLAAAAVLWAGSTAPFVTGAVVLVGFAAVGAPLPAVAAAAGGGVAGLAGAAAAGRRQDALAAGLVLAAGVPASVGPALAVAGALALLAGGEPA